MSRENVEIVRNALDVFNAFSRGEMSSETYAELFNPQIEWHWRDARTIPDVPQHLRGAEELFEFPGAIPSSLGRPGRGAARVR
jgi:hypothetical protein